MSEPLEWSRSRMEFNPVHMLIKYREGMSFHAITNAGYQIPIDAHAHLGGGGVTPNPIDYLLASLGGCIGIKILLCLSDQDIRPSLLEITIDGIRRQNLPATFEKIHVSITIGDGVNDSQVSGILTRTMNELCPIAAIFVEVSEVTWDHRIIPTPE